MARLAILCVLVLVASAPVRADIDTLLVLGGGFETEFNEGDIWDYSSDGNPDIVMFDHDFTSSGLIEVKSLSGATLSSYSYDNTDLCPFCDTLHAYVSGFANVDPADGKELVLALAGWGGGQFYASQMIISMQTNTVLAELWSPYYGLEIADFNGDGWDELVLQDSGQCVILGYGEALGVQGGAPAPARLELGKNRPNPFNPSTELSFFLGRRQKVRAEVYDAKGRHVKTLADREYDAGAHEIHWDGTNSAGRRAASGIYLIRVTAPGMATSRKVALVR